MASLDELLEWGEDFPLETARVSTIDIYPQINAFRESGTEYFAMKVPNVTITNSRYTSRSKYLGECYVLIGRNFSFTVVRSSIAPEDYDNNYMHSHVESVSYGRDEVDIYSYCVGNTITRTMQMELLEGANKDTFLAYLALLSDVITQESQEGIPYLHIHTLNTSGNRVGTSNIRISTILDFIDLLDVQKLITPDFLEVSVLMTENNARIIGEAVRETYPESVGMYFNNGNVSNSPESLRNLDYKLDLFEFKGELITLTIDYNEQEQEQIPEERYVSYAQIAQINRTLKESADYTFRKKAADRIRDMESRGERAGRFLV